MVPTNRNFKCNYNLILDTNINYNSLGADMSYRSFGAGIGVLSQKALKQLGFSPKYIGSISRRYYSTFNKVHKSTVTSKFTIPIILKRGMKKSGEGIVKAATKVVGENNNILGSQSQNIPNVNTTQPSSQPSPQSSPNTSPGSSPQLTPQSSPTNSPQSNFNTSPKLSNTPIKEKDFSNIKPGYHGLFQFSETWKQNESEDKTTVKNLSTKGKWINNFFGNYTKTTIPSEESASNNNETTSVGHITQPINLTNNNNNNTTGISQNATQTTQVSNIPTPSTNSISNDNNINTQQTNIPIAPPLPNKSIHVKPSIAPSKELENIIKSSNNNSLKPSDVKAAVSQSKDSTIVDRHHILTSDSTHVLQGKQALRYFCSYFQNVSLNQLEKDPVFIHYFKELTEKNPSMYTRAFQLALETVYSKRYFQEKDIQEIFKGNLSIKDVIGTNNGKVDSSTFFSVLQTNHLLNQPDFRGNTDLRVVISTSIKSDNLKDITNPYVRQFIQNSKAATGNTLNDVIIDGHYYDFKMTPNIALRQNHIIFFDYHEINIGKKGEQYLYRLHKDFEYIIEQKVQDSKNIEYIQNAKRKLKNIMDNPNTNNIEKILEWNSYVFNFNKRPHSVYFPILVPTDTRPFSLDPNLTEDIKKIDLPISKTLETKAVLTAVRDVINKNDPMTRHKAYLHSKGVIGEELKDQFSENKDETEEEDKP